MRQKPILHARDHMAGGADPIPGLAPLPSGGDYRSIVLAEPSLIGYWPLDEPSGNARDLSPFGNDFDNPDEFHGGVTQGATPGPFVHHTEVTAYEFDGTGGGVGGTATRLDQTVNTAFTDALTDTGEVTVECWVYPFELPAIFAVFAQCWNGISNLTFQLQIRDTGLMLWQVGATGEVTSELTINTNEWTHVVGVASGGDTMKLYWNAALVGEDDPATLPVNSLLRFAAGDNTSANWHTFNGRLAQAAVYNQALTPEQIYAHYHGGVDDPAVTGHEGWVPVIGPDGTVTWQPPSTEIEHGGGPEVGAGPGGGPLTTPPPGGVPGTPTSPGGWSYVLHRETLVLYDSNPARFDVPSRTWVRVPFNTARVWREWQDDDGNARVQWLPDDRGISDSARNGVLRVTEDMVFEWDATGVVGWPPVGQQILEGWFTIEYPILDFTGLPDSDPDNDVPDAYNRVYRLFDLRRGRPVRMPSSSTRAMGEWPFSHPADALGGGWSYTVDNPYPVYPVWAARPLVKPLPYLALSPTGSVRYYQTEAGNPGFGGLTHDAAVTVFAETGDRYTLQAWQDTPYLLRFSTNHFPNYRGIESIPGVSIIPHWMNQPMLSLTYYYDPETIDHTTGTVL